MSVLHRMSLRPGGTDCLLRTPGLALKAGLSASQVGCCGPLPGDVLLTIDGVPLYQSSAFVAHDHTVRVAKADEVAPEDRDAATADIHPSPLILTDDIFCGETWKGQYPTATSGPGHGD